jgi:hypothetical protein
MSTRHYNMAQQFLAAENAQPIVFAFLDFVGEPVFVHSSVGYITWGGEDWLGLGHFAGIEPIREGIELRAASFRLSLSGAMEHLLGEVIYENTAGRLVEIYLGSWDEENERLYSDPPLIIRGTMGPPEVTLGENSGASIVVEDVRAGLASVNGRRTSLEDHQEDWPGDLFFQFLPQMIDHTFVFNGQQFQSPTGGFGATAGAAGGYPGGDAYGDAWRHGPFF